MCLVLLRPIFAPKMKTAPPTGLGSRSCEGLAVMKDLLLFGPDMWSFLFSGAHPKLVRRSDWILVKTFLSFFWRSPNLGRKNRFNFGEDLFFRRSPGFDRKTASIWFKTDENLGQVRLLLFSPLGSSSFRPNIVPNCDEDLFFGLHLISGKKHFNFRRRPFFFWSSPGFGEKTLQLRGQNYIISTKASPHAKFYNLITGSSTIVSNHLA